MTTPIDELAGIVEELRVNVRSRASSGTGGWTNGYLAALDDIAARSTPVPASNVSEGLRDRDALLRLIDKYFDVGGYSGGSGDPEGLADAILALAHAAPEGLDGLLRSMEAFAAARERDVRDNRDAPDNINEIVAATVRGWLARLRSQPDATEEAGR